MKPAIATGYNIGTLYYNSKTAALVIYLARRNRTPAKRLGLIAVLVILT